MKIKLTKRNYLGEGYWHYFQNPQTKEVIREECTKEEYLRMGEKGGAKYNPKNKGDFVWVQSSGGEINVDTPTKELGENEYTETPDGSVFFNVKGKGHGRGKKEDVVNDKIEI